MNKLTTGSHNISVGADNANTLKTGNNNIIIGYNSRTGIVSGSYNTILGGNISGLSSGTSNNIILGDGRGNQRIRVTKNGNVGIGTSTTTFKLTVNGSIGQMASNTALHPDYVFEQYFDKKSAYNPSYRRYSLEEIEIFIRKHKYLPGVQSRAMIEAEQSWNVSENVRTNLEKLEELYLHTIEQEKKIQKLMERLMLLEQPIKKQTR